MCRGIEALRDDFDVALISAGGWGHLLLGFVRRDLKKSAIYAGGALALQFGVVNQRFLARPQDAALVNEHFLRPNVERGRNIGGYL